MKILIVDDSMVMRKIIENALVEIGFSADQIIHSGDGSEAIGKVRSDSPDLVLMDWNMPKVTGIEALRTIRSEGFKMPVIMVTTEGEKTRVIEAIQAGANNYVVKPFNSDDLKKKVKETLGV